MYSGNADQVKRVGTKKSNQLGLYDCSGNVWEWCYEEKVYTENGFIYDESVTYRILRGGSWRGGAACCAVSIRDCAWSGFANGNIGFRVVRTL